ncbi:carbon-nitrogen hydrolase family protein [Rheinheimera riviphila]|uniref:Carbon-nitrogen hydrolase family protein n=1 Tax=Rheinheimera riviphila TaxID=1834037 RepID=A0A437QEX8_9GAMM|nr:carbon-nitrogen hydrolase family protein [Rheinheimera riviphila]RVU33076.1 carbon-nitrogen hydrolase family protein [Rheinheimera riviphila]
MIQQQPWRLIALQLNSQPDVATNLAAIAQLLGQLPDNSDQRPQLVVLPEGALCFAGGEDANLQLQEPLGLQDETAQPVQFQLSALAKKFGIYLLVGTFPTTTSDPKRFAASSLLFSPQGELIADYQKIHLFDALISDGTGQYLESARTMPGKKITLAELGADQELKLGMAVCYDMRFPGLFQALARRGMNVLALPSAFTTVTGDAHWHTLLRARAIETQSFVIAPAQTGRHQNGRETYGHSLIIDPWGRILADAGTAPGLIYADIDLMQASELRERMPLLHHNRFLSEFL